MKLIIFLFSLCVSFQLAFQTEAHTQSGTISPAISTPYIETPSTPPQQVKNPVTIPPRQVPRPPRGVPAGSFSGGILSAAVSSDSAARSGQGLRELEELDTLIQELFTLCIVEDSPDYLCETLTLEFLSPRN